MNTKLIYGVCALSIAATSLSSCSDDQGISGGEGTLRISTSINSDVKVVSRADTEADLNDKLILWISNSKGAVRKYNGLSNVPSSVNLVSDHYIAEGWTGDSISASWDSKYYKGREEFDITNGNTTTVNLKCTVANSVVSVKYSDEVKELLSNRSLTVGHQRGELVFDADHENDKGYFMMPSTDKNLQWNLQGTEADNTLFTKSGVIENAKPATEYVLNVSYTDKAGEEIGGGYFTIEIEENPIVVEDEIVLTMAPKISGYDFDITSPIYSDQGNVGRKSVYTCVAGTFSSFVIESSLLSDIIDGDDVDLKRMSDAVSSKLVAAGINYTEGYDADNDNSWLKLNFEESLLNKLTNGEYEIKFTVTDSKGKKSTSSLNIIISDATIITNSIETVDVWATKATITGTILKPEQITQAGLKYRVYGTQAWTEATTTTSGTTISANLTGLTPGTQYEYVATADEFTSSVVYRFTTETASQLPNSSFENSCTGSDDAICFYNAGESMFWDSGNHGSITANTNITQLSTEKVHAGTYSVKLSSQQVGLFGITKFAAGNIFVGQYLTTNGTNGVLGWGRAWTSRPTKLRGWLHYTPGTVESTSSDVPSLSKGDTDMGIIYIALLDETTKTYTKSGTTWSYPVIVNTGTKEFFSKDDDNVIAYGEKVLTSATSGDSMVEFEITLDYKKNVIPSNIMITCSASRYGDYFAGGNSTLYLDSFELVYE
jgi:hypothetical protein